MDEDHLAATGPLAALLNGTIPALCQEPDGRLHTPSPQPCALLAGAFNPVHYGHWQMTELAARHTGLPGAFELCVVNVDKPPLELAEVRRRLAQFAWRARVWVTRAPTFAAKARLFPGSVFVVGADTAARIVHPRYYAASTAALRAALERIRHSGCRFLVCGREDAAGRFVHCADLALPEGSQDLFEAIPESVFRLAVSSTALRAGRARAAIAPSAAPP